MSKAMTTTFSDAAIIPNEALEGEEGFISRETAASVVRRLADTGEVDWDA